MRWRKLGRVFCANGQFPWMASYAGVPVAERVEGDVYRIYFTPRDAAGRSHVGWLELDIRHPEKILRLSERPVIGPGTPGRFDDAGTTLSSLVAYGGRRYFYYIGWSLRRSVPYHLAIGLAVADSGPAEPMLEPLHGPIVDRNRVDPLFCTAPTVLIDNGHWRMWYLSGTGWPKDDDRMTPSYNTRYAESADGIEWERKGLVVLDTAGDELGFSRPSVIFDGRQYSMWYSVRARSHPYRLGFARSDDGINWQRQDDEAGLVVSEEGWDSEMIAYPHVFDHGSDRYMLYCGNGYGRTGVGLAIRDG
jgi:hypothetical protein